MKRVNGTDTRPGKPFTQGSLNFIQRNVGKMSLKSIANVLHRDVRSVRSKALSLGLNLNTGLPSGKLSR